MGVKQLLIYGLINIFSLCLNSCESKTKFLLSSDYNYLVVEVSNGVNKCTIAIENRELYSKIKNKFDSDEVIYNKVLIDIITNKTELIVDSVCFQELQPYKIKTNIKIDSIQKSRGLEFFLMKNNLIKKFTYNETKYIIKKLYMNEYFVSRDCESGYLIAKKI